MCEAVPSLVRSVISAPNAEGVLENTLFANLATCIFSIFLLLSFAILVKKTRSMLGVMTTMVWFSLFKLWYLSCL